MTKCGTFPVATTTCSGEDALKRVCSTTANRFRAVCEAKVLGRAHHDRILPQGFQVPPRLNAWLCSSGGRDPLIPSCLASFSVSPRLEGRCGFQGFFDPFGDDCLRSIPGEALPFGTLAFPSGRLDRRPDGLRSLSLRSDWFGADRGRLRPPPRSDLRREARIPGCVVATDGDPAQDGVRRQDVVVSTIRFGCRSGESNGPIRIGTLSCSPRGWKVRRPAPRGRRRPWKSRRFLPVHSDTQIRSIVPDDRLAVGRRRRRGSDLIGIDDADRNGRYQDQDGLMLPRVDGDSV